jgi:hypothetical protein
VDWELIKAEYIAGSMGYRKLAKDKGVSFNTLKDRAVNEGWYEQRQQYRNTTTTEIVKAKRKKTVKKAVDIDDVADKLLSKISELMDTMVVDTQSFKQLTSALKDLKDIKGYKSAIDLKEQEARIKKLQMEAAFREEDDDKPSGVVLMPAIAEEIKPPIGEENNG